MTYSLHTCGLAVRTDAVRVAGTDAEFIASPGFEVPDDCLAPVSPLHNGG